MIENGVYYGRGTPEMFDEYVDFINYVFGFNGNSSDFKKLLPKLYQYDYNPAGNSYVAVEKGKIKAAIGAFDHDLSVCGEYLKTRGIGNVAVHPYERSRGFMKKLMNMAIDDMVADGVVLSVLGGRRQRYNYFSYDKLGPVFAMSFNSDNIRHTFGADRKPFFSFRKVDGKDQSVLDSIKALSESKPLYAIRDREKYYEILVSWRMAVYEILREEKFAGYCIVDDTSVYEILLLPEFEDKFAFCVRDLFDHLGRGSLRVKLPLYLDGYISQIAAIGESYSVDTAKSFSVLNFRKVCSTFMKLKATYSKLPDGELCLSIDGRGGKEKILLSVKEGVPSVTDTDRDPDLELGHLEAMNLLFAIYSVPREKLPDHARLWLPLPLSIYPADTV